MATESRFKMSQERYDQLVEELNYLETDREKEVSELIKEARSFGDLSENSEYDEAKREQGKLYTKIAELRVLIENAEIVEKDEQNVVSGGVSLGSTVVIKDLEDGSVDTYYVVVSQEADPMRMKISDDSPFGKAIYGHLAGDKVMVEAPDGNLEFEILSVKNV